MNQTSQILDAPYPISASYFQAEQCVKKLKPDHSEGIGRLIDSAEILIQFGCAVSLSVLCKLESTSKSDEVKRVLDFFFNVYLKKPMSTGHFLSGWKIVSKFIENSSDALHTKFIDAACYPILNSVSDDCQKILESVPQLRNSKKKSYFLDSRR